LLEKRRSGVRSDHKWQRDMVGVVNMPTDPLVKYIKSLHPVFGNSGSRWMRVR
jgi:hypothetical protein